MVRWHFGNGIISWTYPGCNGSKLLEVFSAPPPIKDGGFGYITTMLSRRSLGPIKTAVRNQFPLTERDPEDISVSEPERYATGLPAILSTATRSLERLGPKRSLSALSVINQPSGYDCPGCAWPEPHPDERKRIEFCESGAKAVAEEATKRRADRKFFSSHSVSELREKSDYWLGTAGRLTEPMVKRSGSAHFTPISWPDALNLIADRLNSLSSPDDAVFYTSGRAANEQAYLFQLLARSYGTNNLPDCSNMCHEPTSVALDRTIGVGKGSVRLTDIYEADLVIIAGQNPGTNHPRMLAALEHTKDNGGKIIAINPLPEAGLLNFKNPQRPRGIIGNGVQIADLHLPIKLGADQALFQLWCKWLLVDAKTSPKLLDTSFINQNTAGFDQLAVHLDGLNEAELVKATGLTEPDLRAGYQMVRNAKRMIICWAMGITQHRNAVATIDEIVNLALMGGHIGRPGAGLCPVRGHSNVQGDRTMGVWEHAEPEFIEKLNNEFGLDLPTEDGLDTVEVVEAFRDGKANTFIALGGNFVRATPDTSVTEAAFSDAFMVNISTKLNRSHLVTDSVSLILPTMGRTDRDDQASGRQSVTVEDSMGMVHASTGLLPPPSQDVRSEVSILCGLAEAVLGSGHAVPWAQFSDDYKVIRDSIARTVDGFADFNRRLEQPGGFELPHPPRDSRTFPTPDGKAHFTPTTYKPVDLGVGQLMLQTLRSHDQYNTTIYGHDDRYRGLSGDRHVVMVSQTDIDALGLRDGDRVDLVTALDGPERRARNYRLTAYPTPVGTAAAYYPETNVLIPLDHRGETSHTPASKSIPIRLDPVSPVGENDSPQTG